MNEVSKKILTIAVVIGFFAGVLGGMLTNEYLIAYLGDLFGGDIDETNPIVKRVVEEHTYVESSALIDVVEKVKTSVVGINLNASNFPSGLIVTADGLVMTTKIGFQKGKNYQVNLNDGKKMNGRVVYIDAKYDLAVLQLKSDELVNLSVRDFADKSRLSAGQRVLAVGRSSDKNGLRLKEGIIASDLVDEKIGFDFSGSTGGAVFNLDGQVVAFALSRPDEYLSASILKSVLEDYIASK